MQLQYYLLQLNFSQPATFFYYIFVKKKFVVSHLNSVEGFFNAQLFSLKFSYRRFDYCVKYFHWKKKKREDYWKNLLKFHELNISFYHLTQRNQ